MDMYRSRSSSPLLLLATAYTILVHVASHEQCRQIQQCDKTDEDIINVDRLDYKLSITDDKARTLCPLSDPDVPQWLVSVTNSSLIVNGTFCVDEEQTDSVEMLNDSSLVCSKQSGGELVLSNAEATFQNSVGDLVLWFSTNDQEYQIPFTIKYATTGVYPYANRVHFEETDRFATASWLIYHSNKTPSIKLYHNNISVLDESTTLDKSKYSTHKDTLNCLASSTGDLTVNFSLFILNPTVTHSQGEYMIVIDNQYSATVTLEPLPSPPTPSELLQPHSTHSVIRTTSVNGVTSSHTAAQLSSTSYSYISLFISASLFDQTSVVLSGSVSSTPEIHITAEGKGGNHVSIAIVVPITIIAVLLLLLLIALSVTVLVLCRRRRIRTKNSSCSKGSSGDGEDHTLPKSCQSGHVTRNPTYIEQLSYDPSATKVPISKQYSSIPSIEEVDTPPTHHNPPINKTTTQPTLSSLTQHQNKLPNSLHSHFVPTPPINVAHSLPTTSHLHCVPMQEDIPCKVTSRSYDELDNESIRSSLIRKILKNGRCSSKISSEMSHNIEEMRALLAENEEKIKEYVGGAAAARPIPQTSLTGCTGYVNQSSFADTSIDSLSVCSNCDEQEQFTIDNDDDGNNADAPSSVPHIS